MHDTASAWLTALAMASVYRGKRRTGGWLLVLVCAGYFGILWDRTTGARLSSVRHFKREHLNRNQILAHTVLGAVGWKLLTK